MIVITSELYYALEIPTPIDQTMSESESTEIYELTTNYALRTYQDNIKKQNLNGNRYKKKEEINSRKKTNKDVKNNHLNVKQKTVR